jgi:membrane protein required for colicin V production
MTWVDWVILAVLAVATLGGLAQGFFRTVCSLGGLILGLVLADWNYARVGAMFKPIVKVDEIANTIGFLLIALLVMAVANLVGGIISKTVRRMGLGCLDAMAGAVFGFIQGAVLVMVCILVTVAFFPGEHWLAEAKLPKMFFGACHLSTHMSPGELGDRVRKGLLLLEHESPEWTHPGSGTT